ncbi:uncharacterized protein L969DRAFT_83905 [Mixia osmundae IAM 14324]|uniref:J domain-containing protein n=1 Tax=Mixia osmundae (strain CBS 9802 / IAM 14324 / JCM 22182 / KY 12970) TaxID=764103 RepID=G7DVC1_MIXOS|nr:uncharacterized protein L969DRAFT_83905 [Mixia osmundae IAM 14324]KEI42048.1 hypothetical protein L969DRAFT_83905 [Mixia osmundae IAM 14324]GAA94531.1 hypothetical protein E5Q_01183 [Mixia osmundae IAM 14324]
MDDPRFAGLDDLTNDQSSHESKHESNGLPNGLPSSFGSLDDDDKLQDGEIIDNERYYALLNLPTKATDDEIQRSYRALALALHPDRHHSEASREAAIRQFQEIQRAYEVLSDPQKRPVYDVLGEAGLKATWTVSTRLKTAAQLRSEYERVARQRKEAALDALVKHRSDYVCIIDGRSIFERYERRRGLNVRLRSWQERREALSLRQMSLRNEFSIPLAKGSLDLAQQTLIRNGGGQGNLMGTVKWQFSPKLTTEVTSTVFAPRLASFKATYAPTPLRFLQVETSASTPAAPPPVTFVAGQRVFGAVTAFCTVRTGTFNIGPWGSKEERDAESPTFALGMTHQSGYTLNAMTSQGQAQLSLNVTRKVLDGVTIRANASIGTNGIAKTTLGASKLVTEHVTLGAALEMSSKGVMTVRIRWQRLGQKIALPIVVATQLNTSLALSLSVLPSLSYILMHHAVLVPRRRSKAKTKLAELRKEHASLLEERKRGAEDAVVLLTDLANRRMTQERATDGLVITRAVYGVVSETSSQKVTTAELKEIDVTIALQALVLDGQLIIPKGRSKSQIMGFWDVAMGERKSLRIEYQFRLRPHEATYSDYAGVALPLRDHMQAS